MSGSESLVEAAIRVLNTADPFEKARVGDSVAAQWLGGTITRAYDSSLELSVPDRPSRLSNVRSLFMITMSNYLFLIICGAKCLMKLQCVFCGCAG